MLQIPEDNCQRQQMVFSANSVPPMIWPIKWSSAISFSLTISPHSKRNTKGRYGKT